jgi:hypothetical protein
MPVFHEGIIVGIIGLVGAICVATISGVVSVVGLIISKEQKLSDFRQAWVDGLRDDISHFISYPIMISAYNEIVLKPKLSRIKQKITGAENDEARRAAEEEDLRARSVFYEKMGDNYSKVNIYSTRIRLRLNDSPHETESRALLSILRRMEGFFKDLGALDDRAVHDAVAEIEAISRPLLKKEWERVKSGETTFRIAKYTSLAVSSVLMVAILASFLAVAAYLAGYGTALNLKQGSTTNGLNGEFQNCPSSPLPSPAK